ncbi:hypothetical protein [Patulibacter minatonensis]|uniref:hypothetical protein n=1 Tax=Patulibacter minatonensis TaxID=298163 RepID=UPI000478D978|nr:hypothetical protein [Patulibacter minatonensis]
MNADAPIRVPVPTVADVRHVAHLVYDKAAETSDGKVFVDRCRPRGETSRACRVRITGDLPMTFVLRLRRTRSGDFYAYAASGALGAVRR